ncbi:2,3-bisphosphoglycerate-independent phosphoglycerate mutase, partial [Patescibacteria group bacterium]|nr:2,3-bisphosphoglycerate-independent phosphoglycerate mutase [Patescibacteria group bacterium]
MEERQRPKPVVLAICDGWGVAPITEGNALGQAATPVLQRFCATYPAMTIAASGVEVGLSWGEMGNSEVGHLNIGAGRVYYQTLPRIAKAIEDGEFFQNEVLLAALRQAKEKGSAVQLVGLVSRGNVHSSLEHLFALLDFCSQEQLPRVFVHVILDGRDTVFNAGADFVAELQGKMEALGIGRIASLSGRFYAMDRDNRWERTEKAYRAIVEGVAERQETDALHAIQDSYARSVYDEEFEPTILVENDQPVGKFGAGDTVLFFNFRPDRMRQLTQAVALPAFAKFERVLPPEMHVVTMTEYEKDLPVLVAYPPEVIRVCLAKVIADAGLKQLHIAETEKYAHVTFFLNGTVEEPFPKEDRVIIPSPRVSSYDQKPEMSARELTARVVKEVAAGSYDFIVLNFANGDMVAHTGNLPATIEAATVVDDCLGKIAEAVLAKDGVLFITADHGNAEELTNLQTGEMDKEHSTN